MPIGLIGSKCGMTRVFTEAGESIPVSVIAVPANRITQLKTADSDGYCAVQVAAGAVKSSHVNKPMAGHFAKANVEGGKVVREYRVSSEELDNRNLGDELKLDTFNEGQAVDVCGISKGKGFAGVIKRHNFHMQDATHGNSLSHRAHGSTGQCQTPGRVHKGKKMAGQMGNVRKTVQNQKIVKIDQERNLLLIRGAIPGAPGGNVVVMPSVKAKNKAKEER